LAKAGNPVVVSLPTAALFVYDLDLLIKHFPHKPVDRNMDPIMLFPFRDEIILEALCI
jgi:hypothetical protein